MKQEAQDEWREEMSRAVAFFHGFIARWPEYRAHAVMGLIAQAVAAADSHNVDAESAIRSLRAAIRSEALPIPEEAAPAKPTFAARADEIFQILMLGITAAVPLAWVVAGAQRIGWRALPTLALPPFCGLVVGRYTARSKWMRDLEPKLQEVRQLKAELERLRVELEEIKEMKARGE